MAKHDNRGRGNRRRETYLGEGLLGQTPQALKALTQRDILKQASTLAMAVYKPALKSLSNERRDADALYRKRVADNMAYSDWLNNQTQAIDANAAVADQRLLAAQTETQQAGDQAAQAITSTLNIANPGAVGERTSGTYSVMQPELDRRAQLVESARSALNAQVGTNQVVRGAEQQAVFAGGLANLRANQGEHSAAVSDIRDKKQQVRLERSARAEEEIARLLESEIAKAQARVEMRNSAAQLSLALKAHRIDKANARSDRANAAAAQALDERAQAETERANRADERDADADRRADNRNNDGGQGGGRENNQERAHDKKQAKAAASAIGSDFGYSRVKKHFSAFVQQIADSADVPYAVAAKAARRWIAQHNPNSGGSNETGTGASPNAEQNQRR